MKIKVIFIIGIGLSACLPVFGQHANYELMEQLQAEEIDGIVWSSYHDFFHKHYMNETSKLINGKALRKRESGYYLTYEKAYADSIDSAYTARMRVDYEQRHLVDRLTNPLEHFMSGYGKLMDAMQKWNDDINKITSYKGSTKEKNLWLSRYLCIKQSIETVKNGHEPSANRQNLYSELLNDVQMWHNRLKVYLMGLVCHRDFRVMYENMDSLGVLVRGRTILECQAERTLRLHDFANSTKKGK